MKALNDALSRAKINMMTHPDSTFFTTVCFSLKHEWDTSIPKFATDGVNIKANPEYFLSCSVDAQVYHLLHEAMHVAFMHMLPERRAHRDETKWNKAADYVVNGILNSRGYKMPSGMLHDSDYYGKSVEEVYDLLEDDDMPEDLKDLLNPVSPSGDSQGEGSGDGKPNSQQQQQQMLEELKEHIDEMVTRAAMQSKMSGDKPGSVPGEIEFYLDGLLNPRMPWNRILRKHLSAFSRDDYSYRKLNKRYMPEFYMPSLYSEAMGDVAVIVDTSGSVSDEDFHKFVSETASILRMLKPSAINFVQFDTSIRAVDTLKNLRDIKKLKFTGRGGTKIEPVFEWIENNKPKAVVIFTDGYFHMPTPPKVTSNFSWIIYDNKKFEAPVGKVIHYQL